MRVVISGSSGLIGGALVRRLRERGDDVVRLVRRTPDRPGEVEWDPQHRRIDPSVLNGADVVVALGGASVGRLPWTREYERQLRTSRLEATDTIVAGLLDVESPPPAFVSASAAGYYGSAPGRVLDEASPAGDTFLARLCVEWEAHARTAEPATTVALLRTAPVIERRGVLRPLIRLTGLGLGGPIGRGTQMWPWISLDDEVRAIAHIIDNGLNGPVNLTGPTPATAGDLGRALARRLHRPYLVRAPRRALELALGRDATASLLTCDANVRPALLERSGFEFTHPTVDDAVAAALADTP